MERINAISIDENSQIIHKIQLLNDQLNKYFGILLSLIGILGGVGLGFAISAYSKSNDVTTKFDAFNNMNLPSRISSIENIISTHGISFDLIDKSTIKLTPSMFPDSIITNIMIADNSIGSNKIKDNSILGVSLADNSISTNKIISLDANKIFGVFNTNNMISSISDLMIISVSSAKLSGLITSQQIQSLSALKISGVMIDDQIQSISGIKITGLLNPQQIGMIQDNQILSISYSKIINRPSISNGTNGKDGSNGKDGKNGFNGTNGLNGRPGMNGTNGINGKNGKDGLNGTNGKDGTNNVVKYSNQTANITKIFLMKGPQVNQYITRTIIESETTIPTSNNDNVIILGKGKWFLNLQIAIEPVSVTYNSLTYQRIHGWVLDTTLNRRYCSFENQSQYGISSDGGASVSASPFVVMTGCSTVIECTNYCSLSVKVYDGYIFCNNFIGTNECFVDLINF